MRRILSWLLATLARPKPIWRGVYAHLREVPTQEEGAYGTKLIADMAHGIGGALQELQTGEKPYFWHEQLALTAAIVAARRRRVRVLDFGGGPGSGFVQLLASLPAATEIDYCIVELEPACAAGRKLFPGDSRIQFAREIPHSVSAYDIVYVNSALQYIDDYAGTLQRLAALQAPWLLLARLAAGTMPTFATQQLNVPGQVLPYWFLNVEEVRTTLKSAGYDLVCDLLLERVYDQSNFPATHRAERMRSMLFALHAPP